MKVTSVGPGSAAEFYEQLVRAVGLASKRYPQAYPGQRNPDAGPLRAKYFRIPFSSTDMRVVDTEDPETDVAVDGQGELLLRGPQVFARYWNRRARSLAAFLADGWLRTGHIVEELPRSLGGKVMRREVRNPMLEKQRHCARFSAIRASKVKQVATSRQSRQGRWVLLQPKNGSEI